MVRASISSFSLRSWAFLKNICSFFILTLLITDTTCFSLIRSSSETPWWSTWRVWRGSMAKFIPMPLIFLSWAFSYFDSTRNVPCGKGMNLRSRVHSVSITLNLTCFRFAWTPLTCPTLAWILSVWICNSHISFWMIPSIYMYFSSNLVHNSIIVSSMVSSKSPLSEAHWIRMCMLVQFFFLPGS